MKVAILCRKLDGKPTNGFERYSHNLFSGLSKQGADLCLPNQDGRLSVRPSGSLVSPPYYDIVRPLWMVLTGRMNADVFHAVTDSQAIVFPWLRGKKVVTFHHVDKTSSGSVKEWVFRAFYRAGTRMALRYSDVIICISSQTKKEVMEAYGVPEGKMMVIPQAIPTTFRPLMGVAKERTVGYVGALKKRKNVEFLVRAYAAYRKEHKGDPLRLVICGEGTDRGALEALAKELRVEDGVEFRGVVPEERIVETYNSFSLFVLPSYQEGFGFPIIEAQACGVPVLTVEGAMIPEEVSRHTVKCADERDMAAWMHRMMADAALRDKIIAEGLAYAATFSVDGMAAATERAYEKALKD